MYCKETHQLLEEVAGLSDKLTLEVFDFVSDTQKVQEHSIDRIPAIVVSNDNAKSVRYYGIPGGYEFASLIEDIIDVSHNETDLPEDIKEAVGKITEDVHIQVFVTPT
jgi:alkyl hydroperoxide reductase subunit AhpF